MRTSARAVSASTVSPMIGLERLAASVIGELVAPTYASGPFPRSTTHAADSESISRFDHPELA